MALTQFDAVNASPYLVPNEPAQGSYGGGGRVTFRIPVGPTYHRAYLRFSIAGVAATEAQILAQVANIVVKVGADQKMELTGREAVHLAALYGAQKFAFFDAASTIVQDGVLPIHFAREWMAAIENREATAYGMLKEMSFQIEIDWIAGATIDLVTLHNEITEGVLLGRHVAVKKIQRSLASVGQNDIIDVSRDPAVTLYALHFARVSGAAHAITHVVVEAERKRLIDAPVEQIRYRNRALGYYCEYDASILSIVFAARGRNADALPMNMQDFVVRLTLGVVGSFNIISERAEVQPERQA